MSMLNKIKRLMKSHPDQTSKGIEKAGDLFDKRTKGKYSKHVDKAQDKLRDQYGGGQGNQGGGQGGGQGGQGDSQADGGRSQQQ